MGLCVSLTPGASRAIRGVVVVLALSSGGCQAGPDAGLHRSDAGLQPLRSDSAGVEMVVHPANLPSGPVVTALDEVLYGAPMGVGTLELGGVGDADLLRDGRVVVLDRLAARVCLFARSEPGDPAPPSTACLGRAGEGPGEFSGILTLAVLPLADGGFAVPDPGNGRITTFSAGGEVGSTLPFDAQVVIPEWRPAAGGRVAVRLESRDDEILALRDLAGGAMDTAATLSRLSVAPAVGDSRWPLLPARWVWDVGESNEVAVARTDEPGYAILRDGQMVRRVSWTSSGAAPSPGEVDALYRIVARSLGQGDDISPEVRSTMAPPEVLPSLGGIRFGPGGRVLVQLPRQVEEMDQRVLSTLRAEGYGGSEWLVFSPDGALEGRLRFPGNGELFRVRGDTLVGLREAEDGTQAVFVARWPASVGG
jgi:hypothetical protein